MLGTVRGLWVAVNECSNAKRRSVVVLHNSSERYGVCIAPKTFTVVVSRPRTSLDL